MTAWHALVDDFETRLEQQRRAVAEGRPQDLEAFVPATTVGPPPPELARRLSCLLVAAEALTATIAAQVDGVTRQLHGLATSSGPAQPSSFVDTRA